MADRNPTITCSPPLPAVGLVRCSTDNQEHSTKDQEAEIRAWAEGLGQETFEGSSGRVFPRAMKAFAKRESGVGARSARSEIEAPLSTRAAGATPTLLGTRPRTRRPGTSSSAACRRAARAGRD